MQSITIDKVLSDVFSKDMELLGDIFGSVDCLIVMDTTNYETLVSGMMAFVYDASFQRRTLVLFLSFLSMYSLKFSVDLSGTALE